MDFLEILK